MERRKRPFYIIAHNPNTLEEAKEYLQLGVNALEPDIVHADGRFYVSHSEESSYEDIPTLETYINGVKEIVTEGNYNLALIIFDMKNTDFDINTFLAEARQHLKGKPFEDIAILMTHGDEIDFLNRYNGNFPNVGIGVDETNTPPHEVEKIFKAAGQKNYSYSDGITTLLNKPGVYTNITAAQNCRYENEPDSFKLIYTWSLSREASMEKYLDTYIDGIFVDPKDVNNLIKIVTGERYSQVFDIAQNGYNPFIAPPIPRYKLIIKTKDTILAGTDAQFLFTLKGSNGSLTSLPYNANLEGALERNSTSYCSLEGFNVGEIQSLKVEQLNTGITSDWLPEAIAVESKFMQQTVYFKVEEEAWIGRKVREREFIVSGL